MPPLSSLPKIPSTSSRKRRLPSVSTENLSKATKVVAGLAILLMDFSVLVSLAFISIILKLNSLAAACTSAVFPTPGGP